MAPQKATLRANNNEFNAPPTGHLIEGGVGYLEITRHLSYTSIQFKNGKPVNTTRAQSYIQQIHDLLRQMDANPAQGWILDLRRNNGGDPFPMIVAAGPLLGEGEVAAFVSPTRKDSLRYETGKCLYGGKSKAIAETPYVLKNQTAPIAVLTSPITASGGELLAIALKGRANVRYFGETTFGVPSVLNAYPLPDHATLFCITAFDADRTGKLYHDDLAPDEARKTDWAHFGADTDSPVATARAWIKAQAGR